jgi:hypothetical protein
MSRSDLTQLMRLKAIRQQRANIEYLDARDAQQGAQTAWESAQSDLAAHKAALSGDRFVVTVKTDVQRQVLKHAHHAHQASKLKLCVKQIGKLHTDAVKTTAAALGTHRIASRQFEATRLLVDALGKAAGTRDEQKADFEAEDFFKPSTFRV